MAVLKYYNTATSAWEYIAASTTANFTTWKKTMSGGETSVSGSDDNSVTLSYTVGLEQVFINGVLQARGSDYTATTGTSVTGLTALVASDIVTVVCYAPFNIANTIAPTLVDAKGDLIAGTAADTVGRLAVGVDNAYLRPDSTASTGLKWDNDAWTSYTPVWKQNTTTVPATVTYAKYKQIGKTVFLTVKLVSTGTGSAGGRIAVSAPTGLVPTLDSLESVHGTFGYLDAGTAYYHGFAYYTSTAGFGGIAQGSGDAMGANSPSITVAVNDVVMIHVTYEVA